jgi:hypothetical protein
MRALPLAVLLLVGCSHLLPTGRAAPPGGASGKRVLALVGSDAIRKSHSQFFKGLKDAGLDVDIRGHKDEGLKLRNYDEWNYDHLVVFAPEATCEHATWDCLLSAPAGAAPLLCGFAPVLHDKKNKQPPRSPNLGHPVAQRPAVPLGRPHARTLFFLTPPHPLLSLTPSHPSPLTPNQPTAPQPSAATSPRP